MESNYSDQGLERLILEGFVEVSAMDSETGEMLYSFTDKAKEVFPEIEQEAHAFFNSILMYFWENGFISMNLEEDNPTVRLNPKAFDVSEIEKLSSEMKHALNVIKEILRID